MKTHLTGFGAEDRTHVFRINVASNNCDNFIISSSNSSISIIYCYCSTVLCWTLAAFSVSWSYTQSVGLLEQGIGPSQGHYLHIGEHKPRINAQNSDICALSGIRAHDPSVRVSEDSSCLRPRGHCDRPTMLTVICKDESTISMYQGKVEMETISVYILTE
jgi:hypothetical protein